MAVTPIVTPNLNIPFEFLVELGRVPGWRGEDLEGRNPAIGGTLEDVWEVGGVRTLPTSAATAVIVSSTVNDDSAGTGVRTLLLEGLDSSYNEISETITTDGTTNVNSVGSYLRVNRMTALTWGTGLVADGDITCTVGGNVQGEIAAGLNKTKLSQYTVPNNKTALVDRIFVNAGANDDVEFFFESSIEGGGWIERRSLQTDATHIAIDLNAFLMFPEHTDLRIQARKQSGGSADATAGWDLFLVDD